MNTHSTKNCLGGFIMGVSEKLELLGKGLYKDIPNVITLKSIPTASELDYVGAEDFEKTMLDKIFPVAIEEDFDYYKLLEIDFHWICRALRLLNYGPYITTNAIFCAHCGQISRGEYRVDLRTVPVEVLPEKFVNNIVIPKETFMDFDKDIVMHLPTIKEMLNARDDNYFKYENGESNLRLARKCYMVSSIGDHKNITPVEVKPILQNGLSPADYILFNDAANKLIDYGVRGGGTTRCPKCQSDEAAFLVAIDDKFFRPTLGDLYAWRDDRRNGKWEESDKDLSANKARSIQQNS